MGEEYILVNSIQDSFHQGNVKNLGTQLKGNAHVWPFLQ